MPYYDSDFASVEYDDSLDVIFATMTDYAEGEAFREYMNSIVDAIEDTGCGKLIADTKEMGALDQDDQVWSVRDWSPRAEDAGLKHVAFVMPESVVAEMAVDRVVEMTDDTLNREFFDDRSEARQWAREQTDATYERISN